MIEQLRSENSKLKVSLQQQQSHIHQLTQSLNQCFQAVLTIQRDVSSLQRVNHENTPEVATLEDNLDSVSQQRDFESHPSSSWEFDLMQATGKKYLKTLLVDLELYYGRDINNLLFALVFLFFWCQHVL